MKILPLLAFVVLGTTITLSQEDPADFSGNWETTYGVLRLAQSGKQVSGQYQVDGHACQVSGTVVKGRLTFTFKEPDSEGEGYFVLRDGGKKIQGRWRPKGDQVWQSWSGKRLAPDSGKTFDGLWDTSYGRMRLVQNGTHVKGIYSYDSSSGIEGEVKDGTLRFTYTEGETGGAGWFRLRGDEFTGKWSEKGSEKWDNWSGKRVERKAGRQWLVVIESRWEENLSDREYSFGNMLKTFFARSRNVEVRHRTFTNEKSLHKWIREATFLAEPVLLVIASHATEQGLEADDGYATAEEMAGVLKYAGNVMLLHFSACLIMKEKQPEEMLRKLRKGAQFPVSGYATSVDWAASAIIEFMYFDLILSRGMSPTDAADQVKKLMPFSGDKDLKGAPFPSAGFKLLRPGDLK